MSHPVTTSVDLDSSRPVRVTGTAPARPLLVVETLDHSAGSAVKFTYTDAGEAASGTGAARFTYCAATAPDDTARFTYCAATAPDDTARFTYTYRARPVATDSPQFTFCAQAASTDASGARTAAPVAVDGDAVTEAWI